MTSVRSHLRSPLSVAGIVAGLALVGLLASAAHALRVLDWNILNYPTASGNTREDDYRAVLAAIQPDVIVVQEISSSTGATNFLNNVLEVLEPGEWALAPFILGPDTNNACFYRTAAVSFLSQVVLTTSLRDINGYVLRPVGYTSSAAEFRVYSLHLKASTGTTNENRRLGEVTILRDHLNALPGTTHFLVGGDFNIYTSTEPAWAKLTGSEADNDGQVFDPINRIGNWHNSSAFADVHTQSTRTTTLVDGGSTGGMDDRFDMLLANDDMLDNEGIAYIPGSYVNYGQDGLHFNQNVNDPPTNAAVGQTLANALQAASDHLPVYVDLQVPAQMVASGPLAFGTVIVGAAVSLPLTVQNPAVVPADELDYTLSADPGFLVPGGTFQVAPGGSDAPLVTLDASAPGTPAGNVTVSGDAPDTPSTSIPASATILDHAEPSTRVATLVLADSLDFGAAAVGSFVDQTVQAVNFGYDGSQALLDVHAFTITGADSARFSLVSFTPATVGGTPASFTVHFDDTGAAAATTYAATLTLATRDQQDLPGAADLAALQWALRATVTTATDAAHAPVARTWLHPNVPNPFNPATTIRFDLVRRTRAEVRIYGIDGRLVRTLVNGVLDDGPHTLVWNGRDEHGRPVSSGVYLVRLRTREMQQTRRMTLVR